MQDSAKEIVNFLFLRVLINLFNSLIVILNNEANHFNGFISICIKISKNDGN